MPQRTLTEPARKTPIFGDDAVVVPAAE